MGARWVAVCAAMLVGAALAAGAQPPSEMLLAQTKDGSAATRRPAELAREATPQKPRTPQAPAGAPAILQPVLHAQGAKITTCIDTIIKQSAAVVDAPHTAVSSWVTAAPDQNLFVSIVGLSYKDQVAPNGAAVILAAPMAPGKCEGGTVQVLPTARSCTVVQASLLKEGRTIAVASGLPIVETKAGLRVILLPTTGGGCTIVAVGQQE